MHHRKQHHSRALEPFTVRPGSETGLYYILVANLAHRTTWRELKAFASQACEVDHAEVYPPTSGFVRVKGRANFEKAFKFLDGNTLDYRALQADGRNLNQSTVVKLMPTDYHAARILRGDEGRVYDEPESHAPDSAKPSLHGTGEVLGSPHSEDQGKNSPAFSVPDTQWSYVTSSSRTDGGAYQPAPHAAVIPPISGAYQAVTTSSSAFVAQAPIVPPVTVYQTVPGPITAATHMTQHQYSDPRLFYPAGTAYTTTGVPGYAGFVHMAGASCGPISAMAYEWPLVSTHSPLRGGTTASHINNDGKNNILGGQSTVFVERRRILVRGLERNGLSPAAVTDLLVQNAGIGATPGQVEKVDLPLNKAGKARGIAYITFSTEELASTAVATLDGCKLGGNRKLSARLIVEGTPSPERSDDGAPLQPNQRLAGGGAGAGGDRSRGRAGSGSKKGVSSGKAPKSSLQEHPLRASTEKLVVRLKSDPAPSTPTSTASDGQRKKEERPVIVDGSGGRWKKEPVPVVVDGTAAR
ncbi:hypothetical protein VTH82DRAFT_1100 [Thermothelomyces myriococcoides]